MTYYTIGGPGNEAWPSDVVGGPVLQQYEMKHASHLDRAVKIGAGVLVDYEPTNLPLLGNVTRPGYIARSRSRQMAAELAEFARMVRLHCTTARERLPLRPIIAYMSPFSLSLQVGDHPRIEAWRGDNERVAASGAYDEADALAVMSYLSADDQSWMTEQQAYDFTAAKITGARYYGKRLLALLTPYYSGSPIAIPTPMLAAQSRAATDAGLDVIWWMAETDEANARRQAERCREAGKP